MQELLEKLILLILLVVIFVLGYIFFLSQNNENKNNRVVNEKILSDVENRKIEKIKSGINWFIKNKDVVDPNDIVTYFIYLYKVTNDTDLVKKFAENAKQKSSEIKILDTKFDQKDSKYLDWENLKYIYFSLERKKCKNQDYQKDLDAFKQYFTKNTEKIIPDNMSFSRKLVIYYQFRELGVGEGSDYDKTVMEISKITPDPNSKSYIEDLYAFTHVIFTASGYYSKYLNPQDYKKEIEVFDGAMKYFNKKDLDNNLLDIASEVIVSMKLLKQTQSNDFINLSQRILANQNPDGSFGTGSKKDPSVKIHNSGMALLALINFTPNLRQATNACFY